MKQLREHAAVKSISGIVLLLILPLLRGIEGVLLAGPAADLIAALVSFLVLRPEFRRMGSEDVPP